MSVYNAQCNVVVFTAAQRCVVINQTDQFPVSDGEEKKRCLLLHCNCDCLKSYLDIWMTQLSPGGSVKS